jgi:cytochrome b
LQDVRSRKLSSSSVGIQTPTGLLMKSSAASTQIPVWDLFVRVGHWLLAAGFLVAYITEDDFLTIHTWAGYVAGCVVLLRIIWGFIGSTHARFRDFRFTPRQIVAYLRDLPSGRSERYIGHSPAGAAMIYALLIGVLLTGGSGVMLYAYDKQAGPLAGVVASQHQGISASARKEAYARAEDFWEETHELMANLTLLLVVLHLCGVAISSYAHHENLVLAMITGRKSVKSKRPETQAAIPSQSGANS